MPQVVQNWPKVCGVSVDKIGTGFILKGREGEQINSKVTILSLLKVLKNKRQRGFSLHPIHSTLKRL